MTNSKSLFVMVLACMFIGSCKKTDTTTTTGQVPVLTTTSVSNNRQTTATSGGNISSDGGTPVIARGVCWSTGQNPTVSNSKTTDGIGIGIFTSAITGLTANTIYYVRAYATNSAGTGYGETMWCPTQKEEDNDVETALDYIRAEFVYSDATNIVDDGVNQIGINKMNVDACVTITVDSVNSKNKVLTFDWGTGCTGRDGRTRKGKIVATITGVYKSVGSTVSVAFQDYYISWTRVEGIISLTRVGLYTHTLKIIGGKVTTPSYKIIKWDANLAKECISNCNDSLSVNARKYSITGSSTGTNINSNPFTAIIRNALIVDRYCSYKNVKGTVDITPENNTTQTLDFGDGTCDEIVYLTINGKKLAIKPF